MAGVVGFVLWAGGECEIRNAELAFGGVGIGGGGGECAASGGEKEYVVSARSDL